MKRREIVKGIGALPLSGGIIGGMLSWTKADANPPAPAARNLLQELDVRTFINAAGTYTAMTASLMHEEVIEAIKASATSFCMLNELQDKVGEKIAQMTKAEAAMVTSGAFSALTLGLAGILTGTDKTKIQSLPQNLEAAGMKSEVILQKSHYIGYEQALWNTGVKLIAVETVADLEKAINAKTASMHFMNCNALSGQINAEDWLAIAQKNNIPATIDIAADVPPVTNLWKFNEMGYSYVAISGGKALRGPQSAGILMGKKDIIAAARLNHSPNGKTIGRGMKVNKEEILGMYVALEKYIATDHEKEWKLWEDRIAVINNALKSIDGVTTTIKVPPIANHTPTLHVTWDKSKINLTNDEFMDRLRKGNPSIEVVSNAEGGFNTTVFMLKPGEEKIVAKRFKEELLNTK